MWDNSIINRKARTIAVYNKIAGNIAKKLENIFAREEAEKFMGYIIPGAKILDIGCAAGRDVNEFTNLGYKVIGIDLSEKLLKIAKQKYPHLNFKMEDMMHLSFPDNSFDAVWANAVLHHVENQKMIPVLKEWNRILKSSGIIFISTKMGRETIVISEERSSNEEREFTLLMPDDLDRFLKSAGFEKLELYSFNEKDRLVNGRNLMWVGAIYRKI